MGDDISMIIPPTKLVQLDETGISERNNTIRHTKHIRDVGGD